jgi:putative ABC transport system ATP-binding protein
MKVPVVALDSVHKVYRRADHSVAALDGVSLTVEEHEFLFVVGESGSGKSTLLFTIGGLVRPSSGQVHVEDTPVYDVSVGRRARLRLHRIGFVFQTFNLVPYLTALENVQVPLCLAGKGNREQRRAANGLLERLGMSDRSGHLPADLSVGERQRVAIARALANGPSLILADEPTGNLDPARADDVMDFFQELHGGGMTIMVVSHDPRAAARASRLVRLASGRILEDSARGREVAPCAG